MATQVVASLTKEAATAAINAWGPAVVVPTFMSIWGHRNEGQARKEQEKTLGEMRDALLKVVENAQPREIRVVPEAFNSTPIFLDYYQTAALVAIPLAILQAANAINRVGKSLDGIKSELANGNALKVMGCDGGFGSYVHRFVKVEMAVDRRTSNDADDQHHYFYVWNPDTIWYDEFEERQRQDPLGPAFGGYHHDLATISLRMRSDRQVLIETTDHGKSAVFHLIIPTYQPIVVDHPIAFAEELLPLVITGRRHQGVDLVWLKIYKCSGSHPCLDSVSVLYEGGMPLLQKGSILGCVGSFCGLVVCSAASPLALPFLTGYIGSWSTAVASIIYDQNTRKSLRVLGSPVFLSPSHE